jgi:phosphatidylglycerophosphate synthase
MSDSPPPLLNPANLLTLSRIPLAFAYLALFPSGYTLAALIALTLLELTDMADGFVARKLGCVTDFGKLVDPFCDSFSRLTVFFTLAATPFAWRHGGPGDLPSAGSIGVFTTSTAFLIPLWMPVVCLLRDLTVAFVRTVAAAKGLVVAARPSGKWKALVQGHAVFAITLLAWLSPAHAVAWSAWLMLAATLVTAWSLVDYVAGNRRCFGGA